MNKNEIIAEFMGYTITPITDLTGYYLNYNNLVPAWVKFRELKFDFIHDRDNYLLHDKYRTLIANTITHGTIEEAFDVLVRGIEWYQSFVLLK